MVNLCSYKKAVICTFNIQVYNIIIFLDEMSRRIVIFKFQGQLGGPAQKGPAPMTGYNILSFSCMWPMSDYNILSSIHCMHSMTGYIILFSHQSIVCAQWQVATLSLFSCMWPMAGYNILQSIVCAQWQATTFSLFSCVANGRLQYSPSIYVPNDRLQHYFIIFLYVANGRLQCSQQFIVCAQW